LYATDRSLRLKRRRPAADIRAMNALQERLVLFVAAACLAGMTVGIVIGHYALPSPAKAATAAVAGPAVAPQESQTAEAMTNVRAAVPAMEAWNADHGGYQGATLEKLRTTYDHGLHDVTVAVATRDDYCFESRVGDAVASKHGPGGEILPQPC
jgi:hypothetical protein